MIVCALMMFRPTRFRHFVDTINGREFEPSSFWQFRGAHLWLSVLLIVGLAAPCGAMEYRLQTSVGYEPSMHTVSLGWHPQWSYGDDDWFHFGLGMPLDTHRM